MSQTKRVIVQVFDAAPNESRSPQRLLSAPGIKLDLAFRPVRIPSPPLSFAKHGKPVTYVVRGKVEDADWLPFIDAVAKDRNVVGVFGDPRIEPAIPPQPVHPCVCPDGPIGTAADVAGLLDVEQLCSRSLDGNGVRVAIVDTGFDRHRLQARGCQLDSDTDLHYGPANAAADNDGSLDHGTMCAYDVCIAAPRCTLIDCPVLSRAGEGDTEMDCLLSNVFPLYEWLRDVVQSTPDGPGHRPPLVINNSWAMYHSSWDHSPALFLNYSHNREHPFHDMVQSLEEAGADILFAAGNCGSECPYDRCRRETSAGILGANSHESVLCVAAVTTKGQRLGYSSRGPGRWHPEKPDIACYSHFAGSGIGLADDGTSAAAPVAAGAIAAVRGRYPPPVISPADLRRLICETASHPAGAGFNHEVGHGILNVRALLAALVARYGEGTPPHPPGEDSSPPPKKPRKPRTKK